MAVGRPRPQQRPAPPDAIGQQEDAVARHALLGQERDQGLGIRHVPDRQLQDDDGHPADRGQIDRRPRVGAAGRIDDDVIVRFPAGLERDRKIVVVQAASLSASAAAGLSSTSSPRSTWRPSIRSGAGRSCPRGRGYERCRSCPGRRGRRRPTRSGGPDRRAGPAWPAASRSSLARLMATVVAPQPPLHEKTEITCPTGSTPPAAGRAAARGPCPARWRWRFCAGSAVPPPASPGARVAR